MTQIILENLDPILVEKLQVRAIRQGRSLIEELKAIVSTVRDRPESAGNYGGSKS